MIITIIKGNEMMKGPVLNLYIKIVNSEVTEESRARRFVTKYM